MIEKKTKNQKIKMENIRLQCFDLLKTFQAVIVVIVIIDGSISVQF